MNEEESQDIARTYRLGMCDAAALAIHQYTGWPLALWVGWMHDPDDDEPYYEAAHAVVCDPRVPGRWWDVDGHHDGTPSNLMFSQGPDRIELLDCTVEEIRYAFSMGGVEDDSIEQARRDLTTLGVWAQLPSPPLAPRRPRPG